MLLKAKQYETKVSYLIIVIIISSKLASTVATLTAVAVISNAVSIGSLNEIYGTNESACSLTLSKSNLIALKN
jgi:hypothetical protein